MHERYNLRDLIAPAICTAEFLDDLPRFGEFDIVWISNALDHTSAPVLAWLNLFRATRVGGVMAHAHFLREGTHAKGDQLHKFDLFPENGQLCLEDLAGGIRVSLTEHLPLQNVAAPWRLPWLGDL